jgi:hypothetical protein
MTVAITVTITGLITSHMCVDLLVAEDLLANVWRETMAQHNGCECFSGLPHFIETRFERLPDEVQLNLIVRIGDFIDTTELYAERLKPVREQMKSLCVLREKNIRKSNNVAIKQLKEEQLIAQAQFTKQIDDENETFRKQMDAEKETFRLHMIARVQQANLERAKSSADYLIKVRASQAHLKQTLESEQRASPVNGFKWLSE